MFPAHDAETRSDSLSAHLATENLLRSTDASRKNEKAGTTRVAPAQVK
jgi:hypothetical protein